MLYSFSLSILLQGLILLLFGPACDASSLGLTVHAVPLDSENGTMVKAYFTAIAASPCPSLSGLCAEDDADCMVYSTSLPFNGTKPNPGWCVRQWHETVTSNYSGTISLGSNTEIYVSMNAGPTVRQNSGRLNQPPYVALVPPLRARVNCPHHVHLSAKDLDGDRVRCRFARPESDECMNCTEHSFIELDEEKCMLTFTGKAPAGQYFIYLMAEDVVPVPKMSEMTDNTPLSAVPVHLSLTVEESSSSCTDEPVAAGETPTEDSTTFVLPYEEVKFNIEYKSKLESVTEVAVVGPPELYRVGFQSVGSRATMTMAWIRAENQLASLLPICFAVNTNSLQSEPRCVWLYQREMKTLPDGTELTCDNTEMTLVLPVTSLHGVDLTELQLNSPSCPVDFNSTHLTAHISLSGCGTKTVHAGSELVYTNTLQTVHTSIIRRQPSLTLPLACRIPGAQAKGPQYEISMPSETETFGNVEFWVEVHFPGEGPLSNFTRVPRFRSLEVASGRLRRDLGRSERSTNSRAAVGSKLDKLDLHLLSNCTVDRAQMLVSNCSESETEDFAVSHPILDYGCSASNSTLEILTTQATSKVYRLDLSTVQTQGSTMYIRCTVYLCIATLPSLQCPDLCAPSANPRAVVNSLFTKSYTINSGPVSLVVTTPEPKVSTTTTATTTTDHAPERASAIAAGLIFTTISIFLQNVLLY
ncbi:uncharacterized protein LOC143322081 [Chaetodon auriga]|uniref:uncharacterized protein LOC143322081 n=1 Tax=Chaetodon auriga TaxID=39042 RepID=UPI004032BFC2